MSQKYISCAHLRSLGYLAGAPNAKAALTSGAQIISTDYYLPSTHFPSTYSISFADKTYFRWNPISK